MSCRGGKISPQKANTGAVYGSGGEDAENRLWVIDESCMGRWWRGTICPGFLCNVPDTIVARSPDEGRHQEKASR
ncbi:hypothetical protein [Desulforhopalus singaporensis]|uniref:hypothetical protein n=1 Tax=Desulforhopalus singaporensis TaxID=91360 RepID=UPI000B867CFD|nr:hypothetical protein [Desulforhopalus singaporensis]